ncbi:MAG: CRISPR-associated endonuclease Cas1 [Kofleriaceae bacterium]|nr:CRISPR-associated endonuclease Cas1 [Kofleriaceae bacterium]
MAEHELDDAPSMPRAKPLPRRLPLATEPPELVPARMINEAIYCERLMYLEWAQGEFTDNAFTVDGRAVHARADVAGGQLPPAASPPNPQQRRAKADDEESDEEAAGPPPYQARSIWLSSVSLGVTAKIDVVEGSEDGVVVPIEYKRGAAPDVPEGAHLPERAQVCAQVLLLREHGYRCDHGEIYFARTRRRVRIEISDELVEITQRAARRAKDLTAAGVLPDPLVDSKSCEGCSLVGICLPDEVNLLRGLAPGEDAVEAASTNAMDQFWPTVDEGPEDGPVEREVVLRRLQPARDDELPLYVQEQGAKISLSGEELVVRGKKGDTRARLPNVSQVSLFGNVQISTQALRAILERGVSVSFLSTGGWFYGRATGVESKNVELRVAQHRAMGEPEICLQLARGIVASKIRNARTLLRRNHAKPPEVTLFELEQLAKKAENAESIPALLGIEGTAARSYFGAFSGMLKGIGAETFDLDGRNRRPPRDPVNALLSLAYSLLTKDFAQVIASAGLDPLLGFYHQPRFGRPSLALDLMEEFRPIIADSTVISAINNGVVEAADFTSHPTGVALRPAGRRNFILAYERRMDQLVTHPVFGYRVSYRRVLEVQARLLGRFLMGEIPGYPEFRTR